MNVVTQLTQFVAHDVITKTRLTCFALIGCTLFNWVNWVELCRYKRALTQKISCMFLCYNQVDNAYIQIATTELWVIADACDTGVLHQGDWRVDDRLSTVRFLRSARVRVRQRRTTHGSSYSYAHSPAGVAASRSRTLGPYQLACTHHSLLSFISPAAKQCPSVCLSVCPCLFVCRVKRVLLLARLLLAAAMLGNGDHPQVSQMSYAVKKNHRRQI